MRTATFAAGCFWGIEAAFRRVPGVTATAVGYIGGATAEPTYREVYEELLELFWQIHDPTQVNRQGPDFGSQYRTAIFTHDAEQEAAARASKERLAASGRHARPIATEIVPAATFWRAEDYHQQYFEKRGLAPACGLG